MELSEILSMVKEDDSELAQSIEKYHWWYEDSMAKCRLDAAIFAIHGMLERLDIVGTKLAHAAEVHDYLKASLFPEFLRGARSCPMPSSGDTTKDLLDSMQEEKAAAEQYKVRADAANGDDLETKHVYKHVIDEENEHYDEFNKRLYQIENQGQDTVSLAELQRRAKAELGIS